MQNKPIRTQFNQNANRCEAQDKSIKINQNTKRKHVTREKRGKTEINQSEFEAGTRKKCIVREN